MKFFKTDPIASIRAHLFNRGMTIFTSASTDNKHVEAIATNADVGLWRKVRKAAAKTNALGDGYLVVLILWIVSMFAIKTANPISVRAKASCNEGDTFSFETGQKLAKARVRYKLLWKQQLFMQRLSTFMENVYCVTDAYAEELYEDGCRAEEHLDDLLEELHQPLGE